MQLQSLFSQAADAKAVNGTAQLAALMQLDRQLSQAVVAASYAARSTVQLASNASTVPSVSGSGCSHC